jgi:hypothetical protein
MHGDMHDMLELQDTVASLWRLTCCFLLVNAVVLFALAVWSARMFDRLDALLSPKPDPDDVYHMENEHGH